MKTRLLLATLILACGLGPLQAETRSLQLTQDPRGPITYDTSTRATTFPGALTPVGNISSSYTTTAAGPGTVRNILGKASVGTVPMTSGNIVGTRGEVNVASGATAGNAAAYLYGTQGKFIGGGTITQGNIAGLMGQVDASAGTYTAGVVSALWLDMGASASASAQSTSFGGASQILRMTNTTNAGAAKTTSIMDVYANSPLFMTIGGPAGTTDFVQATTTNCGSGGAVTASKAIKITVSGTDYFIPLCPTK